MRKIGLPVACILMLGFTSCYYDKANELYPGAASCDTATVTYSGTIKTITGNNCAFSGCHAGAAPAANINLETYAGAKSIAQSGQLHGVINHINPFSPMPKNTAKLSDCNIAQIEKWIAAGAPNN